MSASADLRSVSGAVTATLTGSVAAFVVSVFGCVVSDGVGSFTLTDAGEDGQGR